MSSRFSRGVVNRLCYRRRGRGLRPPFLFMKCRMIVSRPCCAGTPYTPASIVDDWIIYPTGTGVSIAGTDLASLVDNNYIKPPFTSGNCSFFWAMFPPTIAGIPQRIPTLSSVIFDMDVVSLDGTLSFDIYSFIHYPNLFGSPAMIWDGDFLGPPINWTFTHTNPPPGPHTSPNLASLVNLATAQLDYLTPAWPLGAVGLYFRTLSIPLATHIGLLGAQFSPNNVTLIT